MLLNDWSARDVQAWEYVPLGPFNSKNFGTSISAWVVLAAALEPFRARGLESGTELLPYLREDDEGEGGRGNVFDIKLEVDLKSELSSLSLSLSSSSNSHDLKHESLILITPIASQPATRPSRTQSHARPPRTCSSPFRR